MSKPPPLYFLLAKTPAKVKKDTSEWAAGYPPVIGKASAPVGTPKDDFYLDLMRRAIDLGKSMDGVKS